MGQNVTDTFWKHLRHILHLVERGIIDLLEWMQTWVNIDWVECFWPTCNSVLCLIFANMCLYLEVIWWEMECLLVSKKNKDKTWTFHRVQETITLRLPYDKNLTFMWAVAPVFTAPCSPHRLELSLWFLLCHENIRFIFHVSDGLFTRASFSGFISPAHFL